MSVKDIEGEIVTDQATIDMVRAASTRRLSRKEMAARKGGAEYSIIQVNKTQSQCESGSNAYGSYTWAGGKCYLERYM